MRRHARPATTRGITESLTIDAPAKLNATLRVLGKRDDGYHELESEFVSVSLFDTLRISRRDEDELVIAGPCSNGVPTDRSNLVWKAIDAWSEVSGRCPEWHLHLTKRIPNEAGLGGGSSDAAAALWAVNRLSGDLLNGEALHRIAAGLGSDLNFFLDGHLRGTTQAICRGRGERVQPISRPRRYAVIAKPPLGLSTAAVFHALSTNRAGRSQHETANNLQPAAEAVSSELRAWRESLDQLTGRRWTMTGSGSAYFAWVQSPAESKLLTRKLAGDAYDHVSAVETAGPRLSARPSV